MFKKIFKKATASFVAIALCCTTIMSIAAEIEEPNTVIITPGVDNSIIVEGVIAEANRGNSMLVIRFVNENGEEIYMDYTYTEKKDGVVTYEFPELFLPSKLQSGVYKIVISGEDIVEPLEKEWEYNGHDRKLKVLDLIQKTSGTTETVASVLSGLTDVTIANTDILAITDFEVYKGFGKYGQEAFEAIITDDILKKIFDELPHKTVDGKLIVDLDAYGTADEKEKIDEALKIFRSAYNDAIAAGLFAEAKSLADFEKWYSNYYIGYKFDSEVEEKPNVGITTILNAVKGKTEFINRISKKTDALTIQEIKEYIYESAILSYIETKTIGEIQVLLHNFDDKDEFFYGFDANGFDELGDDADSVLTTFKNGDYEDCDEALETINKLIKSPSNGDTDNDNSHSGSSGGSRGNVSLPVANDIDKEEKEEQVVFSDLGDVEWAKDAIEYLATLGIVNGKAEGIYAPNDNITRAEFVKMVVIVLGISSKQENVTFVDVDRNAWYMEYVAAAYNNGIVFGDDEGRFYPDNCITRQDMAVILYRAANISPLKTANLDFVDADEISDYAVEAVSSLTAKGVINGFTDGSFGATENATRAQTAVMIHRLISGQQGM